MAAALRIEGISTSYDRADVLTGVSLVAAPGEITCLLGSNGSGKTTLIRSILGLTPPHAGRIFFGDVELTRLPTHQIVRQGIACIPEGRKTFPHLTVEENLRLGAYAEKRDAALRARFDAVYGVFPRLAERRAQLAGTMSGGEQAMVSIGRGLMGAPRLLLVDEPSLGLSPLLVKENFAVLQRINAQGIAVFLVEQNVRQTLAIAHRGYVFSKGRVVACGSAAELGRDAQVQQAYFGVSGGTP
ncbi:MAG: ABC transporter ATP-binding protein [Acidobacteriota bacterium]|nr:ABC transporter ATP-binding protein [Acidobacteriota bacterium]